MVKGAQEERARYAREITPDGRDSLSKIARLIAPGSRVLDVGTGGGALGRYLSKEKQCALDGIEMDAVQVAEARPAYRTFLVVDLESAELDQLLPEAEYDAIVCADVLEHLRNPGGVVKKLLRSLRPSGRLIVSIPNIGYAGIIAGLFEGDFRYSREGLLDNTHVRFFTRNSLLRFLRELGLQPLSLDFVRHTLDESEFRDHHLDALPPAVRAAILAIPDALTYQFIVEAATGGPAQPIVAPLERPRAVFGLQLYWRTAREAYSDATSLHASGELGVDPQEVRFQLPKEPLAGLRFDVADRPGFLRIRSISLLDRGGAELWRWSGEALSIAGTASKDLVEFSSGSNRWWLSTGNDPFVELPVPAEALARCGEGSLSAEIGWPISADFFVAERLISEETKAFEAQLKGANARMDDLAKQGAREAQLIGALQDHVGKAESQLRAAMQRMEFLEQSAVEFDLKMTARVQALEDVNARDLRSSTRLHPYEHVRRPADKAWQWEATAKGARFLLGRKVKRGWYRVVWQGRSQVALPLKLYVDYGSGFSEEHGLVFGGIDEEEKQRSQYIPIDRPARVLRIDVGSEPGLFDLVFEEWSWRPSIFVQFVTLTGLFRESGGWRSALKALAELRSRGIRGAWRELRRRYLYGKHQTLPSAAPPPHPPQIAAQAGAAAPESDARADAEAAIARFSTRPLVSVLVPCYDTDQRWLTDAVNSVRSQFYPHWELILVDDGSTNPATQAALREFERASPKIRVLWRERNGGISAATNAALEAATGELVALLDHDDMLAPDALFEVVRRFDASPDLDAVYTDQDKIDEQGGRYESFFKPDWSPELFRGVMYVGHLLVVRRRLAVDAGGFDSRFDKVQDFEFMLRVSERTDRIGHVPKVLYHWRAVPGSVARAQGEKSGIAQLQASAVSAHLARLGVKGVAAPHPEYDHRVVVKPRPIEDAPLVSIVIPTKDAPHHISRCLDSIFERTTYPRFEVVVVDNGTTDERALAAIGKHPVSVVPYREKFNFSLANNLGVENARGEILILLNNDTEVIDPDWIETLVFHLLQPGVGIVGPLLLYPNGSVQHAGVVIGFRGTADHVMRGFPGDTDGYAGSLSCSREVSAVTGACLAIRREDYRVLGGLVDHYATHYQDVDFCLRVREQGKRILFVPRARLYHHEGASRGTFYDLIDRALLLDCFGDVIARGDPYYNSNFTLERFDYTPRQDATT
jgi:GT2 family glycosyltransferase/2-polyprenyl-3-methyl-5-hydroxy-6-metoxy-1,4-benzoquinol methylase